MDLSSRLLIGRAYLKVGYARAAEQELRRAQLSGADRSLTTVPLGTALLQQGKHDDLFAELPLTVREPALRAEIHLLHGKAHLALRGLPKAQSNFRAAEKLLRDDARPPVGRAQVMLHRGRFAQARALIDQITTASPKHADAWYVKSELHRAERDFEAALDSYDQVLAIDDRHITARLGRAATLIDLDQDMKALDDLRVVWSIRPDDPQAYYLYALVLSKMNEIDKAQAMLERASMGLMRSRTEFVMRHPPSLLLMGVIYFKNGRIR